jgi:outer membrane protein assembly factor BamB
MISTFMRIAAFLLLCLSLHAKNPAWPNWLGPNHDGTLDFFVLPVPQKGKDYVVDWSVKAGRGWASPVCDSKVLVLHEREGENEVLRAMDPSTGKESWRFSYRSGYRDSFGMEDGPRSTPAISDGIIVSHGPQGLVHAVSMKDGALRWKVDLVEKFSSPKGFFGRCSSPLVTGGNVIFDVGGPDAGMVALDLKTGKLAWSSTSYGNDYSSAVPFDTNSGQLVLSFMREGFLALNAKSGKEVFFERFRSPIGASVNAASPVVVGKRVLLSSCYEVGAGLWAYKATASGPGGGFENLWKRKKVLDCHYSSPVAFGDFAYGFHGRQERGPVLRCIRLKDGKVMWEAPSMGAGNLIRAKDKLLVLSENGELVVAEASPAGFRALHRQQILGTGARAHFALANGRLFARDQRRLVCLRLDEFE